MPRAIVVPNHKPNAVALDGTMASERRARSDGTAGRQTAVTVLFRLFGAAFVSLSGSAVAVPVDVLWYTYAHPDSEYVSFYSSLAGSEPGSAASYPESGGLTWNVSFFGPSGPSPDFAGYDVLVIHSGEAFRTNAPGGALAAPDFAGILSHRGAIEAARGNRTFISGSDADFHAVRGDSGLCPGAHCGDYDGALGYVINAVNWAGSGAGLGIVSFFHGEFPGSFWWDDPSSFLRRELQGSWGRRVENAAVIPAAAAGYAVNHGLTGAGLSDWTNSFHGNFANMPGYVSTVDSGSHPGSSVSIATIDLCRPTPGRFCLALVDEPPSALLLGSGMLLLLIVLARPVRSRAPAEGAAMRFF